MLNSSGNNHNSNGHPNGNMRDAKGTTKASQRLSMGVVMKRFVMWEGSGGNNKRLALMSLLLIHPMLITPDYLNCETPIAIWAPL